MTVLPRKPKPVVVVRVKPKPQSSVSVSDLDALETDLHTEWNHSTKVGKNMKSVQSFAVIRDRARSRVPLWRRQLRGHAGQAGLRKSIQRGHK